MADDPTQLNIKIATTSDTSGLDQTGQGIDALRGKTQEAAGEASEAIEKGGKEAEGLNLGVLGSLRTAHHLIGGLKELGEGGTSALTGVATEGRVVAEVFEGMLGPMAGPAIIIATLAQLGLPALMKAFGDAKDEGKDDAAAIAEGWKAAAESIKDGLEQVQSSQKEVNRLDKEDLDQLKEKQTLSAKQAALDEKAAEERLRAKYIQDEANPDLTPEQRKQLKDKFDAGIKDLKDQTTVNVARSERDTKAEEYDKLAHTASHQRQDIVNDETSLKGLKDLKEDADSYMESHGWTKGKDGALLDADKKDVAEQKEKEIKAQQHAVENAKRRAAEGFDAPTGPNSLPTAKTDDERKEDAAEVARQQQALTKLKADLDQINVVGKNSELGDSIKTVEKNLQDAKKELDKTTTIALPKAAAELAQAAQNADLALGSQILDAKQRKVEADLAVKLKARHDQEEAEKAQREADQTGWESELENLPQDDPKRPGLERQIAQGKYDQTEADKYSKEKDGDFAEGSPQANLFDQKAASFLAKLEGLLDKQHAALTKKDATAENKELTPLVAEATGLIKQTGNASLEEHVKSLLAAVKNNPQERMLDLVSSLTAAFTASHGALHNKIGDLQNRVSALSAEITKKIP